MLQLRQSLYLVANSCDMLRLLPATLVLFFATLFLQKEIAAQTTPPLYEKEWKRVSALAAKNRPASALEEVKKIYSLAKRDGQEAQVIKTLLYMSGLQYPMRKDNEVFSILDFEKEIPHSSDIVKAILKNILAEIYWSYYTENRWQFYRRSETTVAKAYDIATWNPEDFHRTILPLYLESLQPADRLKQTKPDLFEPVIVKGNVRGLRPTLYDMLAHRALDYLCNDELTVTKPVYAFEIRDAQAFSTAADFSNHHFTTSDSNSSYYHALLLFQELTRFHLGDSDPAALIDLDIRRLQFCYYKSIHPNKSTLYFTALQRLAEKYPDHPAAAQAWYLLAQNHANKADQYKPYEDSTYRLDHLKAKAICETVLKQPVESEGWTNSYNLLQHLQRQSLEFELEKINVPNEPFRALVRYRNIAAVHVSIIPVTEALRKKMFTVTEDLLWLELSATKQVYRGEQALPASEDMHQHEVEIRIDSLPVGEYWLIMSSAKDYSDKKILVAGRSFHVSNISYVSSGNDYFVLDRNTGQPLGGAVTTVWQRTYDDNRKAYVNKRQGDYTADQHGHFFVALGDETRSSWRQPTYELMINYRGEQLHTGDALNSYFYYTPKKVESPDKTDSTVFFFTDRAIYRPGQTLFFKGIALMQNTAKTMNKTVSGYETLVFLYNANDEEIDSLKVTTNEFGSFSGKFHLPAAGRNGEYSIRTFKNWRGKTFRVEEYKRPTFEVKFEELKGSYRVNDSIRVTGIAQAYAGYFVDGATVSFRVMREYHYPYPWLLRRRKILPQDYYGSSSTEITYGEIKTGMDGKFVIAFNAKPDSAIDKSLEPLFAYNIYADVTDISGETQTANKTVTAGYRSLRIAAEIPERMSVDSFRSFRLSIENMNGEQVSSSVAVTIAALHEEKRLIRYRFWNRPDQFVMTKADYIRHFPYDEYDNESDFMNWGKAGDVYTGSKDLWKEKNWSLPALTKAGFYIIEIRTKDTDGDIIVDRRYIELYDPAGDQLSHPRYLWVEQTNTAGDKATVQLASSAENVYVIQTLSRRTGPDEFSFVSVNSEKKNLSFAITEADRGGMGMGWVFVKHNRMYRKVQVVDVPWNDKDLFIEYVSYRDKTLPGSRETWKLKISGNKKEKIAAEMLATMYDASLDQLFPHQWQQPHLWSDHFYNRDWNAPWMFTNVSSRERERESAPAKTVKKHYDIFLANYVFAPSDKGRKESVEPLWWLNPLDYFYSEARNPRLMRLPKAVLPDSDGDGVMDRHDKEQTPIGCPVDDNGVSLDSDNDGIPDCEDAEENKTADTDIPVRKNFNETAFFYPDLYTDADGNIEFSFTLPESLTRWKFMAITHTKDAAFGSSTQSIVTQKQLMVQSNHPRFLRQGDRVELAAKVINISEKEMMVKAELQLIDAETNRLIDTVFKNANRKRAFSIPAGQSVALKFPVEIPVSFDKPVTCRIIVQTNTLSDGEEMVLPVLTNRQLVTESMPLMVKGAGTKSFSFDKLLRSGSSNTLQQYSVTTEFTSSPAWQAIQALPYLVEFPYECAEQTWNRYYGNAVGNLIINSSPQIRDVLTSWKNSDSTLGMLQKNPELKSLLLEETPWLAQGKTEAAKKKNMAAIWDQQRLSKELYAALEKLAQLQTSKGGFAWFKGGPENMYITQYIITGIGRLKKISEKSGSSLSAAEQKKMQQMVDRALTYLDKQIKEEYEQLKKEKGAYSYFSEKTIIQNLYMRSFFPNNKPADNVTAAYRFFYKRLAENWTSYNMYMQAMAAVALFRPSAVDGKRDVKTAKEILVSLKENTIYEEGTGRYWKEKNNSWYWYDASIERQAMLIEAFGEIGSDDKTVDELRTWLLLNKQPNNWSTTIATADACYALLLNGSNWLTSAPSIEIKLGNKSIQSTDSKQEAGSGYFKTVVAGNAVQPSMGNISVTVNNSPGNSGSSLVLGNVYWQYLENLDKITEASGPLKLAKQLFIQKNTATGPLLHPVKDGDVLKPGDKIKVRIEIRVDRDMEYVHLKDMRASSLEPDNVISGYRWQNGLGYYEMTKDAATHFFFDRLPKGVYVFEYSLHVTHAGNFSNGISSIQCMYAPEFTAHSEGIRITVK